MSIFKVNSETKQRKKKASTKLAKIKQKNRDRKLKHFSKIKNAKTPLGRQEI